MLGVWHRGPLLLPSLLAFLVRSAAGLRTTERTNGMGHTALVLRTAKVPPPWVMQDLIPHYKRHLKELGVPFCVLHDATESPLDASRQLLEAMGLRAESQGSEDGEAARPPADGAPQVMGKEALTEALGFLAPRTTVHVDGALTVVASVGVPRPADASLARALRTAQNNNLKDVGLCTVSWDLSKVDAAPGTFDQTNWSSHVVHDQTFIAWWRHCRNLLGQDTGSQIKNAWFVEADAFFNGDIGEFLKYYIDNSADVIGSGFRIAGEHWWKIKRGLFDGLMKQGLRQLNTTTRAVDNVFPLPTMKDGFCADLQDTTVDDNIGVLFFQDHVVRISMDLLAALEKNLERGIHGPSESYLATVCAEKLGLSWSRECSIHDFAPLLKRDNSSWVVEEHWCWLRSANINSTNYSHCTPNLQSKWIHRLNLLTPNALECRWPSGS